jgi:hypothetical protein
LASEPITLDIGRPSAAASQMQQQQLVEAIGKKLPGAAPAAVDQAAREFLEHLRSTSPILAGKFAQGAIDVDALSSRIDVFLSERPELSGRPMAVLTDPKSRVVDLLKKEPGIALTDLERRALADRFIERLGTRSQSARDSLLAGKMSADELQSRVTVFSSDLRAEASRVAVDPAIAAAPPIVEAYLKANFGSITERPESMCYRGVVEEGAVKREFVIFKKRPNKLRIHIMKDALVAGIIGYDSSGAWRQTPGKAPVAIAGAEAGPVAEAARFDDPLVGFNERGAVVRLESKPANGPIRLRIRESDGSVSESVLDPASYTQLSLRTLRPDGRWDENRFRDYRKVGSVNIPFIVEKWSDGVLKSTTRIADVGLDSGVLDRFFERPVTSSLDFMDYMQALAIMDARAKSLASQPPASLRK